MFILIIRVKCSLWMNLNSTCVPNCLPSFQSEMDKKVLYIVWDIEEWRINVKNDE